MHKRKILATIAMMALVCHLMLITSVWAQDVGEEPYIVMGDLEGPDSIPPPKHYRTREMMLAEAGMVEASPGPPPIPVAGTRELLVILVEFSDVAPDPTHTAAYFNDRFFDTAPPSVRDYYDEVSYGSFTYVPGAVMGWYASTSTQAQFLGPPVNHYPVFAGAIGDVDPFFDFGTYDTDNNGVVENEELTLFMIVTGNQGGAFHTWNRPNVATADTNTLGNPVSVEGEYSVTHEFRHIGSYAHELGHDLGLPDLYDTDATITGDSEGIGNYGLMGGGSWTFSHMTAWSKIQLGWITPTIVEENRYYDVHDAETNAEAYILIDPSYSTDEYFLIENRHPANSYYETIGPPIAPSGTFPDAGIVIYHIDEARMQDWINFGTNNVNVDETHKGVDVETAEHPTSHVINADDLDAGVNRGDSSDLWDINEYNFHDGSTPCNANWYATVTSYMDVRDLPAPTPTMRVYLSVSPSFVTDTSYCWFDMDPEEGQQFRLLFTPDVPEYPNKWRLTASNPGQLYYNVFFFGTLITGDEFTITLPYPFVTQGAMPIHVYDSLNTSPYGCGWLFPGNDVTHMFTITPPEPDPEGVITLDDYTDGTVAITISAKAAYSGFLYITVHLDYGLKKEGEYGKNPFTGDATKATEDIVNYGSYTFSVSGPVTDTQTIENSNVFKHDPGFAGIITDNSDNPMVGVTVRIFNPNGDLIASLQTDEDGFYSYLFTHKGKPQYYTIEIETPSDYTESKQVVLKANKFVVVNFQTP